MPSRVKLGNLTIDSDGCAVLVEDRRIPLTFLEYELLMELYRNSEKVLSRQHLLSALWNGSADEGPGRKLGVHICRLRRKLRGSEPWVIANVRKRGYVLRRDQEPEVHGGASADESNGRRSDDTQ